MSGYRMYPSVYSVKGETLIGGEQATAAAGAYHDDGVGDAGSSGMTSFYCHESAAEPSEDHKPPASKMPDYHGMMYPQSITVSSASLGSGGIPAGPPHGESAYIITRRDSCYAVVVRVLLILYLIMLVGVLAADITGLVLAITQVPCDGPSWVANVIPTTIRLLPEYFIGISILALVALACLAFEMLRWCCGCCGMAVATRRASLLTAILWLVVGAAGVALTIAFPGEHQTMIRVPIYDTYGVKRYGAHHHGNIAWFAAGCIALGCALVQFVVAGLLWWYGELETVTVRAKDGKNNA